MKKNMKNLIKHLAALHYVLLNVIPKRHNLGQKNKYIGTFIWHRRVALYKLYHSVLEKKFSHSTYT